MKKKNENICLIMGILAIVTCWILVGSIFGIIGIVFFIKCAREGLSSKKPIIGVILSAISIILVVLLWISIPDNPEDSHSQVTVSSEDTEKENAENEIANDTDNNEVQETNSIDDEEYLELLENYNKLFSDQMLVISDSDTLIEYINNGDIDKAKDQILIEISKAEESEGIMQEYLDEFDENRTEPPFGTKIMTMFYKAQSAITQYRIALQNLSDYINGHDEDLSGFNKYMDKTNESINDYKEIYETEIEKLQ